VTIGSKLRRGAKGALLLGVAAVLFACAHARPALAQNPCDDAGLAEKAQQARQLVREKKHEEAVAAAEEVLATCSSQATAVAALGEALVAQNKNDQAISRMGSALRAKSDLAYAYYWRGKAYNAKKQPAPMVDDFEAFLKLAPDAPEAPAVKQLLAAIR
jgi:tetratricopeptide (TPR) repeat protein